jgi:hypothetical protein
VVKRRRRAGSLQKARLLLWEAIKQTEAVLRDHPPKAKDATTVLHALAQGSAQYLRLTEVCDHEKRLKQLEREFQKASHHE